MALLTPPGPSGISAPKQSPPASRKHIYVVRDPLPSPLGEDPPNPRLSREAGRRTWRETFFVALHVGRIVAACGCFYFSSNPQPTGVERQKEKVREQ